MVDEPIYYLNGAFLPASQAVIPVTDLAVLRGYGVFESFRTYGGKPFRMAEHLERLQRSAELIALRLPWSREELAGIVLATLARNPFPEASIRVVVTGGESENLFTPQGQPGLVVLARPLTPYPEAYYRQGVRVATAPAERFLPQAKTIHYVPGMVALAEARARDPDIVEVIYVDRLGRVTEGVTSNVFAFIDGRLVTPGADILYGVTRQVVLELAAPLFEVEERELPLELLRRADEIFLTGSVREIMPVCALDGATVGAGGPGKRTRALMATFRQRVERFVQGQNEQPGSASAGH